ncbi:uncharacterized protein LOC124492651 isoform X2 [Dermatophagoides farinae]|uniref:uncharacterized protein LOC124492651 isoform X2 n=1 Tax=Dermatophagoides farinae TaxID=6954 RepID=UPI003F5F1CBD
MPLIQRNLFPSRPPSKKCDGPSVLRAANNINNNHNNNSMNNNHDSINNRTIINPNLSLYSNANKLFKPQQLSTDQSIINVNNNNNNNNNSKGNGNNNKKDAKKLRKIHSTSMISLLAINNNNNLVPNSGRTKVKISYDSQDSFNTSSDTSSDPNSLCSSSSSSVDNNNMISRRRILSRSRDALNNSSTTTTSDDYTSFTQQQQQQQHDEDVWYNKTKLISDHVDEIITKWDQIDDEIWAKVICMERNRRVAKAYARTPILTINGFNIGFDGHRIGLNGFKNPMRDRKCFEIKNQINDGIKIRMDENGNLLVKRITDADVFLIHFDKMDNMIIEKIEQRKSIQLFDMKQYHNDLLNEFRLSTPNTRLLEQKCFCFISFVSINTDELLLNTPVWCILINLVALEMLMKLLPPSSSSINRIADNFYSLPITISSSSKFQNGHYHFHYNNNNNHHQSNSLLPPKLPPRDLNNKNPPLTLPEPDYEDDNNNNNNNVIMIKQQQQQQQQRPLSSNLDDDPYFYGLSAHVPKFYNNNQQQQQQSNQRYPMMPRTNQPPIVRKAMIAKKLWNNQQPSSSSSSLNMNSFYPNHNDVFRSTIFDPITMIPPPPPPPSMIPAQMNNHGRGSINNNNIDNAINDNNEIYGINPSLLRKNTKFHPRTSSSPSSSSLRNIFSRKNKSSGKDQNNNPRKH